MNFPTTPCRWCGAETIMLHTKMCDRCWNLDTLIKAHPELAERMLAEVRTKRHNVAAAPQGTDHGHFLRRRGDD
jgi:hypothetical protein